MGHNTIEWLYVGAVVGVLIWVGAIAWDGERLIGETPENAITIKVTAQQWFWTFEHPDGTKEIGYYMHNEYVPDICEGMGLSKGTSEFGQCVIRLIDKL